MFSNVENLFDDVKRTIHSQAFMFSVVYDEDLGYPKNMHVDPFPRTVHDDYGWAVPCLDFQWRCFTNSCA